MFVRRYGKLQKEFNWLSSKENRVKFKITVMYFHIIIYLQKNKV